MKHHYASLAVLLIYIHERRWRLLLYIYVRDTPVRECVCVIAHLKHTRYAERMCVRASVYILNLEFS